MRQNQVNNVSYLNDRRKHLRSHLTPAEATLWKVLKGGALKNKKFRRQHSVGNYILDFYCPDEKLAVELDGQVHNAPMQSAYDEERTKKLTELGIKVIRFENKVIFHDLPAVLDIIASHFVK